MLSKSLKIFFVTMFSIFLALGILIHKSYLHRDTANVVPSAQIPEEIVPPSATIIHDEPVSDDAKQVPTTTSATNVIDNGKSIIDVDLSQVSYRIPITLISTSTDYQIGDTIEASYDFPMGLSSFKKNGGTCVSASATDQSITDPYIVDDNSGVIFDLSSDDFSTKRGTHFLVWNTLKLLRQFALTDLEVNTPPGRYRMLIISRKPCVRRGASPVMDGGVESIDDLFSGDAMGTIMGIGYSDSFTLQ